MLTLSKQARSITLVLVTIAFLPIGCSESPPSPKQAPPSTPVSPGAHTNAGTSGTAAMARGVETGPSRPSVTAGSTAPATTSSPPTGGTTTADSSGGRPAAVSGNSAPLDNTAGVMAGANASSAGSVATDAGASARAGAPSTTGASPAHCAAKPGAKRGKSSETIRVGDARRSFVYYAPPNLDPNQPVPLVIVPHGYTQSGEAMYAITKYPQLADRESFVAIFPDGAPGSVGPWDVGSGVCGNGTFVPGSGDDQAFVDAMIAFAEADQCIDRDHIFMTGWSMGGYLSNHSGCLRSDIRAIGPHSAGSHDLKNCKTARKPVILFHFDPDGLIDFSCGRQARDRWVERNGCKLEDPDVTTVKGGRCEYYKGCPTDGQVAFCTFDLPPNHLGDFLAGHAWSGGTVRAFSIAETESAAELGYSFFKKYAW